MTLKKTTIPQLPVATTFSGGYLLYQQGSTTKRIADTTIINAIENRDLNPIEVTYDQLETLSLASALISGGKYLITYATAANIPLIVEAVAVNKIGTDAKSPDFPEDVIEYNFLTDTILWRWDTINDISVAQDLRNLVGLTIQGYEFCSGVHCGKGVTGVIGAGSKNWRIGPNAIIMSGSENTEIDFAGGAVPYNLNLSGDNNRSIRIAANSNFTCGDNNTDIDCGTGSDLVITSNVHSVIVGNGCGINAIPENSYGVEFRSNSGGNFDGNIPLLLKTFMPGANSDWTASPTNPIYAITVTGVIYSDTNGNYSMNYMNNGVSTVVAV